MSEPTRQFGDLSKGLARNPLGIIALFIVLVYGFASLVTASADSLTHSERIPLIYFLVLFPVLVLVVFTWLVSKHSGKLFAPTDFKNEDNFVKMQLSAVASLAVASLKNPLNSVEPDPEHIVRAVQRATSSRESASSGWRNKVLWVDDRPENNVYVRQAFEAMGLKFTLSLNTVDALERLSQQRFAAVISDMGRKEGPREGYVLLDSMRERGDKTSVFFYAGSNKPEHKRETHEHGGQGCTNDPNELFQMVMQAVVNGDD